jgi:hypothetical protein
MSNASQDQKEETHVPMCPVCVAGVSELVTIQSLLSLAPNLWLVAWLD